MSAPSIDSIRQKMEDLSSEYGARFAGQSRVTRDVTEIDDLLRRARSLLEDVNALPAAANDGDVSALREQVQGNVELFDAERRAIAEAKSAGPRVQEFAALGTAANLVFARYRRHFAGKQRSTRDLGLLGEMVDDLTRIQTRMRSIAAQAKDTRLQTDIELVANNLKMYVAERGEIVAARNSGTLEEQGDVLAEVANAQFALYQDHFAGKSRLTRRPALLQRINDNLRQARDRMESLRRQGLASESNAKNVEVVDSNLRFYAQELEEIRKARKSTRVVDLMGNLGGAANDVMSQYRESFAGKDRKTRDLELLSALCDQLGELARQMADLGRAEVNEMNIKNLGIVTDNLVMLENEWGAIAKLQGVVD